MTADLLRVAEKAATVAALLVCIPAVVVLFAKLPGRLQISLSILAAGAMVSAAVWLRPSCVVNVYGSDWRIKETAE